MKSLITTILLFAALSSFAQNNVFDKLADRKDITYVSVPKALLKMTSGMVSSSMNGVDIKKIINKLDQVNVFTAGSEEARKAMRKEVTTHLKNGKSYEMLMKVKEKGNDAVFYGQKDGDFIKSFVMFVDGETKEDDCVIIQLLGKFTMQDIQEIMSNHK